MEVWSHFGQFKVGIVDVEWLGSQDITTDSVDPSKHLAGRIFYPTTAKRSWWHLKLFRGTPWLPGIQYAYGLSSFLFFRRPKGYLYWLAKQALFVLAYIFGRLQRIDFHEGTPLVHSNTKYPVIIFSHGLGGHRGVYSITCSELASQGYVVLAVEHAEGTASAAKLAGGKGYRFYKGLGGEEVQVQKTRDRVVEMKTALRVLRALHKGEDLPGLSLSYGCDAGTFFKGAMDLRCLAAVGHSFGGATTAALVSEDPMFRCGVCLDPWWPALFPETAALDAWRTKSPLLILGSHDWNVPNINGELLCDAERQKAILDATKIRRTENERNGGGSMLLVIAGSSHNTYSDPLALFSEHVGWIFRLLGLTARLDPVLGVHLVNVAILGFLSTHLPLSAEQRQLQTWAPSSGHSALHRISELDDLDRRTAGKGPLAWLFPGRGVFNAMSDMVLDRMLGMDKKKKKAVQENGATTAHGGRVGEVNGAEQQPLVRRGGRKDSGEPDDVVSAEEVLESALPSAEPASGQHPHAPGVPLAEVGGEGVVAERFDARQRQILRASVGHSYADAVRLEHRDEALALLGEHHVFKCEVHV